MAPLSFDVSAGDDVLASQYNNLRTDVLDPELGHKHTGLPGEGAAVAGSLLTDQDAMKGDGSDGSLTLSTLLEVSETKHFTDLTINSGGEIRPAAGNFLVIILVQGTLTVNSGGKIQADGFGGIGGSGEGVNGANGFESELGGIETNRGGLTDSEDGKRSLAQLAALSDSGENMFIAFGAGGGGSPQSTGASSDGGDKWAGGGASSIGDISFNTVKGGDGGGCVIIFAESVVVNSGGELTARGIDAAQAGGFNPAGGGGGGLLYVASRSLTETGLLSVAGGLGGIPVGGSPKGGDGAEGTIAKKTIPG